MREGKMKLLSTIIALAFVLIPTIILAGTTYYVNGTTGNDTYDGLSAVWDVTHGPKITIQAGIDVSTHGDTVLVADGTYKGDGNRDIDFGGRAITLRSEHGADSTVIDCEGTQADPHRGFYFHVGETRDSVLYGFTVKNANMQGIYCYNCGPTIFSCHLINNTTGILLERSTARIEKAFISENADNGMTFGIGSDGAIIRNSVIRNNSSKNTEFGGGGIYTYWCNPLIENCIIADNYSYGNGGGIACGVNKSPRINNCIIYNNHAEFKGGGIFCYRIPPMKFFNCIIVGNTADMEGGGIWAEYSEFSNCIVWNNQPNEIIAGAEVEVNFSNIKGGWTGAGGKNIDADPLFVDELNNDYRLLQNSPCIDAGTSDNTPIYDSEGRPRFDESSIPNSGGGSSPWYDIGAYEYNPDYEFVYYVNCLTGNDTWDGLAQEWNGTHGPKKTIQTGIDAAILGNKVIVADGTYTGIWNRDIDFKGEPLILRSENGASRTIINAGGTQAEPHRVFYFHSGEDEQTSVEGFTIVDGYASQFGGGILCDYGSSPVIRNCVINENKAGSDGGGFFFDQNSNPQIINCLITANEALAFNEGGGAAFCYESSPIFSNCTISSNIGDFGGGIASYEGNPAFENCILWGNENEEIYVYSGSATVSYSNIEGGWSGTENIDANPLFISGSLHNFYLSSIEAGQPSNSPCLNAGSDISANFGLEKMTTQTNHAPDKGIVDMGYHVPYSLRIYDMIRNSDNMTIYWHPADGVSYIVEWSEDMLSWTQVPVGQVGEWTDTDAGGYSKKFYRVKEE
jgi:hypothetical protein